MKPLTVGVLSMVVVGMTALIGARTSGVLEGGDTVAVVHWTTGHLLRDGSGLRLLRQMADEFNREGHRLPSGPRIRVQVHYLGGAEQVPELVSRVTRNVPLDRDLPNPTLVTPSASHWLVNANYQAGREIIDLSDTQSRSLARAYVGIVTYRDMAECLGWPAKEIGYADIIALRDSPEGWAAYPCAKADWGQRPLVAFTDPSTSDTGRAVLMSLYAIAAAKSPHNLSATDVNEPAVVDYVRKFQGLVDHYMIGTIPLNTKVHQGPRYGHFFLMPEDNLIHLYEGTEKANINGVEATAPPITKDMVMLYPKEGSLLRENCACPVNADWVTPEQRAATEEWIAYLREDAQQRSFMVAGFRPGTALKVGDPISPRYGLTVEPPRTVLQIEQVNPAVAQAIDASWTEVKRPGVVALVVDTSGSMSGTKLQLAKEGLKKAFDAMAQNNMVGLASFADSTSLRLAPRTLSEQKFQLNSIVEGLRASGGTALYDAILAGVGMVDETPASSDAIRGVIVLTDGRANAGRARLTNVVSMSTIDERQVRTFDGFESNDMAIDTTGTQVHKSRVIGDALALDTRHPVQVFFIGIGEADLEIGRILAQATGAEFQGATEKDLASVLEAFSKYF